MMDLSGTRRSSRLQRSLDAFKTLSDNFCGATEFRAAGETPAYRGRDRPRSGTPAPQCAAPSPSREDITAALGCFPVTRPPPSGRSKWRNDQDATCVHVTSGSFQFALPKSREPFPAPERAHSVISAIDRPVDAPGQSGLPCAIGLYNTTHLGDNVELLYPHKFRQRWNSIRGDPARRRRQGARSAFESGKPFQYRA